MRKLYDTTQKNIIWLAIVSMIALLVFSPISAAIAIEEAEADTTTTTTIIAKQEGGNSPNETSSSSSIIIDKSRDLTGNGLLGDIEDRIDDLIASAANNTIGERIDDMELLSGKVASARFNLSNGQIEQIFFGNWSAEIHTISNASFMAEFRGSDGNNITGEEDLYTYYRIDNLTLNSFQRINDHVVLGGTVDLLEEKREKRSWQDVAISIVIINDKGLVISFEEDPEINEIFSNQPIIGVMLP